MRDANSLRLRLVVQRHALPEVRVVFAVSLDNDPTIANLLEQVNEIIPLESNDWGLEDYTVQLRDANGHAFDCLHFQHVSAILNNDEVVFIRALDTNDRRKRRLAGRDQITTDGRHLIDGVAFGRPRLKPSRDRPPVDIPPLKRRRLTYGDDSAEDDGPRLLLTEHGESRAAGRRVRIRAPDDTDGERPDGDEEDEDGDFTADESDGGEDDLERDGDIDSSELEDELRDLQADNEQLQEETSNATKDVASAAQPSAPGRFAGLDLQTLDKISALRAAFPTAQFDVCERALAQQNGDVKSAYSYLQAQHKPLMSLDDMLFRLDPSSPGAGATGHDASGESEVESVASIVKHYDQHGFPSGSVHAGTAAAQMAKTMRKSGLSVKSPVHTRFDDNGLVQPRQVPPPDTPAGMHEVEGEDESSSEHDSESDSGPEVAPSKPPPGERSGILPGRVESSQVDRDSTSKDLSENEGSEADTSESDQVDSSEESSEESSDETSEESSDDSSEDSSDESSEDSNDESSATDASADPSEDADGSDSADRGSGSSSEDSSSVSSGESSDSDSSSDDESSDSSVDDASKAPSSKNDDNIAIQTPAPPSMALQKPGFDGIHHGGERDSAGPQKLVPPGQGKTATQKRNARRRAARAAQRAAARGEQSLSARELETSSAAKDQDLNDHVAAKKAALLQRLGLGAQETPSTHGTESVAGSGKGSTTSQSLSAAKDSSASDVTSKKQADNSARAPSQETNRQANDKRDEKGGSESWRNKIVYRAVECCHDGVELSEPPFPFVQRWDPQQQYGDKSNRGGRSKRKQRDQQEYRDQSCRSSAKRRKYSGDFSDPAAPDGNDESYADYDNTTGVDNTVLNYDDDEGGWPEEEEGPSAQDAEEEGDLPPLPADVSALPILERGKAVPGMILTWKQLLLSKATNWQPQVSSLTGIVVNVPDDNTIEVRLAKRDRNLDRNEKVYDDDGNRIYDKFELPGLDDDGDDAAEQGYRTLDFADLMEPRILQYASEGTDSSTTLEQPSNSTTERPDPPGSKPNKEEPACTKASGSPDGTDSKDHETQNPQEEPESRQGGDEIPAAQEPIDTSISEDRRREISLLIHDAGFRKDVDPSVTDNRRLEPSSPYRQSEEMADDAPLHSEVPEGQDGMSARLPTQNTSNNVESQPTVVLEPFHGFSDYTSEVADEGPAAHPSETGSFPSGRQIDPDFSIELGENPICDLDDPATNSRSTPGRRNEDSNSPADRFGDNGLRDASDSSASDSSFPSLSDVWSMRSTNRSKTHSRNATLSTTKKARTDEANLPVDEDEELSSKLGQKRHGKTTKHKPALKMPGPPSQGKSDSKSASTTLLKIEEISSSPPRATRKSSSKTKHESNSQSIPEGSQVVSLSSDSSESELEEYYAEDSIDGTYVDPDMPTGPGWVKKTRARRGASVPVSSTARASASRRISSSQPQQSTDKRTTAALNSLLRAKKRVLAKNTV